MAEPFKCVRLHIRKKTVAAEMVRVLRQVFTVRVRRSLVGVRLHHRRFSGCPSLRPSVRPEKRGERLRSCGQTDLTLLLKSMSSREAGGKRGEAGIRGAGRTGEFSQGVIGDSRNLVANGKEAPRRNEAVGDDGKARRSAVGREGGLWRTGAAGAVPSRQWVPPPNVYSLPRRRLASLGGGRLTWPTQALGPSHSDPLFGFRMLKLI